jgi:hypothetical protein
MCINNNNNNNNNTIIKDFYERLQHLIVPYKIAMGMGKDFFENCSHFGIALSKISPALVNGNGLECVIFRCSE